MRVVYPIVTAMGFGNNLPTLAKAHLIAESCDLSYQTPEWPFCEHVRPLTSNGYGYYFPTTLRDSFRLKAYGYHHRLQNAVGLRLWSSVYFSRRDYEQIGLVDVGEACRVFLQSKGLDDPAKSLVVSISGKWGAFAGINRARGWITDLLLNHADTRLRLAKAEKRIARGRMRVAVNIRMGDFAPRDCDKQIKPGEQVVRLPMEWYTRICRLIRKVCDCDFLLVTDGTREELKDFLEEFEPIETIGEAYQDLLGLLMLSRSDLVICSNSTYSRIGCFLNDKPYIWPGDTLHRDATGHFGYLWMDENNQPLNGQSRNEDAVRRCFALGIGFRSLPEGLRRYLGSEGKLPIEVADDILYQHPVAIL